MNLPNAPRSRSTDVLQDSRFLLKSQCHRALSCVRGRSSSGKKCTWLHLGCNLYTWTPRWQANCIYQIDYCLLCTNRCVSLRITIWQCSSSLSSLRMGAKRESGPRKDGDEISLKDPSVAWPRSPWYSMVPLLLFLFLHLCFQFRSVFNSKGIIPVYNTAYNQTRSQNIRCWGILSNPTKQLGDSCLIYISITNSGILDSATSRYHISQFSHYCFCWSFI